MSFFKNLFQSTPKADLGLLIAEGALVLDVRTPPEYASGHIKGSLNIPLNELPMQMAKLKKDKPIIACCASGMRSASAKSMLKANGFAEVHNAGSWFNLKKYER